MKKRLAILLLAALILTCAISALSASAATYTDKINLMPASKDDIAIAGGTPLYSINDGSLSLTVSPESSIAWPSVEYLIDMDLDLSKTPYLHMNFETSGAGDRGVNGHLVLADANGNEFPFQLSMLSGNSVDDFRDTADLYIKIDLAKAIEGYIAYFVSLGEAAPEVNFDVTGKLTLVKVDLSVYGGPNETIVWNTLALASSGDGTDEPSDEPSEESPSEEPSEAESSEVAPSGEASTAEPSSEAPAESSTPSASSAAPVTSANASTDASDASSEAPAGSDGIGTLGIVLIVVGCVAVVAAVAVVILKKK